MQLKPLPLVLIPGFMLDETMWDQFISLFPDDRRFICTTLSQGRDIEEMAAHIVSDLPQQFILIGFSLGGYVARAIADVFPERVAGMVLIATSLRETSPTQRALLEASSRAVLTAGFNGISAEAVKRSLHFTRHDNVALIEQIRAMGKRLGPEEFVKQALLDRAGLSTQPYLGAVLVVAAAQDRLRSYEESQELAEYFAGECRVVEESGHLIPLERPQELAEIISDWLCAVGL